MLRRAIALGSLAVTFVFAGLPAATAQQAPPAHKPGELLVRFQAGIADADARARLANGGGSVRRRFRQRRNGNASVNRLYQIDLPAGVDAEKAAEAFRALPGVEVAQPNYLKRKLDTPNDPMYSSVWGLENTGQDGQRGPLDGKPDADIDYSAAWDLINASGAPQQDIIVAVIDTGVDYNHPDLAASIWVNPGENPNDQIDNDGNGYVNDIRGWDFAYSDNNPSDVDGHGSHVAGTIAGATNNGVGVAGVARRARIMICKFLDDQGSGSTADAIEAIIYATDNGARVLNNSWGGGPFEQALFNAISDANAAGVAFIAAAGNDGTNNDVAPHYPSNYEVANVVSVAASDRRDRLTDFSNYGIVTVDIFAPGEEILSTTGGSYAYFDGTSMATPCVSGIVATIYSLNPSITPAAALDLLYRGAERSPAFAGRVRTEGRANLANSIEALLAQDSTAPAAVTDLAPQVVDDTAATVRFTAPGDNGTTGRATWYDLRYGPSAGFSYASAARASAGWFPAPAGALDRISVKGLVPSTSYTFQLQVVDNVGNRSALSNALVLTTAAPAPAILVNDVEGSQTGWVVAQTKTPGFAVTTSQSSSPTHSWTDSPSGNYPTNQSASLTSPPFSLVGASGPQLTFRHRYALETNYDFGRIEVSTNGTTYTQVASFTGTNTTWSTASVSLASYVGQASVRVRFRLTSDNTIQADGWYVDDIRVESGPATTLFADSCNSAAGFDLEGSWGAEASNYLADTPGANYVINVLSRAAIGDPIDLSGMSEARFSFDLDYSLENTYDFLFVEASPDGVNFEELARYTGTSAFARRSFDLQKYCGFPAVTLRWVFSSDYDVNAAGVRINDVRVDVTAYGPPNLPPDAVNDAYPATEDTPLVVAAAQGLLANDTDPEQGSLTASLVTAPPANQGGVVVNPNGSFTFTPFGNYSGPSSFTYQASDGTNNDTATVTITIASVPDAPVAQSGARSASEDGPAVGGTLAATDGDPGTTLTYSIVAPPSNGAAVITNAQTGAYTYTPNVPNYNGPDSFTFKANDGGLDSNVATITVTIAPVPDAPVAQDGNLAATEDAGAAPGTLPGADVDTGDALTFAILAGGTQGVALVTNPATGAFTYTPNGDAYGADSFTFQITDSTLLTSNIKTISVTIAPVPDVPVAQSTSIGAVEDGPAVGGTLPGSDADGPGGLTFTIVANGTKGTAVVTNSATGAYTYTPNSPSSPNYFGPDSFTFQITDTTLLTSNVGTISVNIGSVNDVPVAQSSNLQADEDGPAVTGFLAATDIELSPLTYSFVALPTKGSVNLVNATTGEYTYTPNVANNNEPDSFTFKANDGTDDSIPATVSVTIQPVNDAPVATGGPLVTNRGVAKDGQLAASDVESASLTFAVVSGPSNGTLDLTATSGVYTYTPNAGYTGEDGFTFKATDDAVPPAESNVAAIAITVLLPNDPPVAQDGGLTADEDGPAVTGQLVATDAGPLTYSIVAAPTKGIAVITNAATGAYTYTPNVANYNEPDSFTFKANDGQFDSNVATVSVDIQAVNDAPAAASGTLNADEDGPAVGGQLVVSDIDSETFTFSITVDPTRGTVDLNAATGAYTYTPTVANFFGSDSFTFQVSDGQLPSNVASVSITIASQNDVPVAQDGSLEALEDGPGVGGQLVAADIESTSLTYSIFAAPTKGTVNLNPSSGAYTYTPNTSNYHGPDSFTFRASDGPASSNVATVTVAIASQNDAPSANAGSDQTVTDSDGNGSQAVTLAGSGSDVDGTIVSYSWRQGSPTGPEIATGQSPTVTLAVGVHTIALVVTDDLDATGSDTVVITVQAGAPQVLASDGFESTNFLGGTGFAGAWTTTGGNNTANTSSSSPFAGSRHARLRSSNGHMRRVVNLTGVTQARLQFRARCDSFENGETAVVTVHPNGYGQPGAATIRTFVSSEDDDGYQLIDISIATFAMTSNFTIAFDANMSGSGDEFFVDEVKIIGVR